jgi:sugar/nucleoside kinase (ribokinase family)
MNAGQGNRPLDVFVVSGVGVDTIVRVPTLALPRVDSLFVPPIRRYVGHTGNGVALGCKALGLRTAFVDMIGDDPEGDLIRASYREKGLEFGYVTHPAGTRQSVILVDPDGRRLSFFDGRQPNDAVPDASLWRDGITRARHVHVSIMPWARHALADAIAAGKPTSTDLHDWDGTNPYHHDFAYGADIVFVSATALGERIDEVLRDILDRGRAKVAVATDGERGSRLAVRGQPIRHIPAVTLADRPVVDSNGAGDSYVAAFLATVLRDGTYGEAALAGSIAGAYACGSAGTHTSFIDRAGLAKELAARGV